MATSSFSIRNSKKGKIGPLEPTYKPPESLSSWKPKNDAWNAIIAKIHAKVTQQSIVKHLQENAKQKTVEKDVEKDTLKVPQIEPVEVQKPQVQEKPDTTKKDKKKKKVRNS